MGIFMLLLDKHRQRLIQLLGMLGSGHEGEMVNAARLVCRFMTDHKLYWGDVIAEQIKLSVNGSASTGLGAANRAAGGGRGEEAAEMKRKIDAAYQAGFQAGVNSRKPNGDWKAWARSRANDDRDCISSWEFTFFSDFAGGRFAKPTAKQRAIFERVAERLDLELPESNYAGEEPPF